MSTLTARRHSTRKAPPTEETASRLYVSTLAHFSASARLSQAELAEKSGFPLARIGRWMRGEEAITADTAALLSTILRCDPAELASGPPGPQESGGAIFATHDEGGRPLPVSPDNSGT